MDYVLGIDWECADRQYLPTKLYGVPLVSAVGCVRRNGLTPARFVTIRSRTDCGLPLAVTILILLILLHIIPTVPTRKRGGASI